MSRSAAAKRQPQPEPFDWKGEIDSRISSGAVDPHKIAAKVAPLIPDSDLRDVVNALLGQYTRLRLLLVRNRSFGNGARSSKVETLKSGVGVFSVDAEEWKHLRDLTPEECEFIAEAYTARARANSKKASAYRALAKTCREMNVKTVGGLPEQTIKEIMS